MNKASTWIVITVVVSVTGSALALMNNACKTSHHSWCAPGSSIRHQASRHNATHWVELRRRPN